MGKAKIAYVILFFVSITWIVSGTSLIIYTKQTRRLLKKPFYVENLKIFSLIGIVLGLFLIIGGSFSRDIFWLSLVLGLLAIAKGVYFFKAQRENAGRLFDWWYEEASDETIRFWSLVTLILGILILAYLL